VPYYRCPECQVTVYGVAGYSHVRACPICDAPLDEGSRVMFTGRRRHELHRQLARVPRAAGIARRELRVLLEELDGAEFEITTLLTTELIANSVLHAGASAGDRVTLDVTVDEDCVHVSVHDGGGGFAPVGRGGADPLEGHWGLHLVEELADRWAVDQDDGTAVWFELDRAPHAQPVMH
jgi:anti-sigma regulatory factor (Ser/Thr protein kinase)